MDIDGYGGRREFGLRGQRRGTESDEGTAANSLSGYQGAGGGSRLLMTYLLL
jgi:hypothetical protein